MVYKLQNPLHRKVLRGMGYISDQKGIINRYLNQQGGWDSHLSNCKRFIERSATLKGKNTVAVLGSGWLLDVSIEFLIQEFNQVLLIDIVHPPQIAHKIKRYSNVHLLSMDLTGGGIQSTNRFLKHYKNFEGVAELDMIAGGVVKWEFEADLFISLNLLNQLDILLLDYIKKWKILNIDEEKQLRRIIQENHLRSLPVGKSCLITDFEELIFNKKNEIVDKHSLVYVDLPEGRFSEKWRWNFDLTQTYYPGQNTVFNVIAIDF